VFPNEKREILAGCAKDKGGPAGCRKGQPSDLPFSAGQLNVQPTGPFCCAARQPVENSCFSFGNIALRLVLSVNSYRDKWEYEMCDDPYVTVCLLTTILQHNH